MSVAVRVPNNPTFIDSAASTLAKHLPIQTPQGWRGRIEIDGSADCLANVHDDLTDLPGKFRSLKIRHAIRASLTLVVDIEAGARFALQLRGAFDTDLDFELNRIPIHVDRTATVASITNDWLSGLNVQNQGGDAVITTPIGDWWSKLANILAVQSRHGQRVAIQLGFSSDAASETLLLAPVGSTPRSLINQMIIESEKHGARMTVFDDIPIDNDGTLIPQASADPVELKLEPEEVTRRLQHLATTSKLPISLYLQNNQSITVLPDGEAATWCNLYHDLLPREVVRIIAYEEVCFKQLMAVAIHLANGLERTMLVQYNLVDVEVPPNASFDTIQAAYLRAINIDPEFSYGDTIVLNLDQQARSQDCLLATAVTVAQLTGRQTQVTIDFDQYREHPRAVRVRPSDSLLEVQLALSQADGAAGYSVFVG